MHQRDYILRQIELFAQFWAKLLGREELFPEEEMETLQPRSLELPLERELVELARGGKIDEAENRLFDAVQQDASIECLRAALTFYRYLQSLGKERLEAAGFSEDEVEEGLYDIQKIYQIPNVLPSPQGSGESAPIGRLDMEETGEEDKADQTAPEA